MPEKSTLFFISGSAYGISQIWQNNAWHIFCHMYDKRIFKCLKYTYNRCGALGSDKNFEEFTDT